VIERASREWP